MELREILRQTLDKRCLSQKWLADKINVTDATISRTLNGINVPSADLLLKMGDALGVSCDYLLGRTPDPSIVANVNKKEYIIGRAFLRCNSRDRRIMLAVLEQHLTDSEKEMIEK